VLPWGDPPSRHWFGLTDGWYWIEPAATNCCAGPGSMALRPCVDYQVVRLWEDITVLTPELLEPVPADLVPFIASPGHGYAIGRI
jgi:hypothetical protein